MSGAVKRTIRDAWESYALGVLPADAPPVQVQECRRAFYGGAVALLTLAESIGVEGVSPARAVAMLETWSDECDAFVAAVRAGRA